MKSSLWNTWEIAVRNKGTNMIGDIYIDKYNVCTIQITNKESMWIKYKYLFNNRLGELE